MITETEEIVWEANPGPQSAFLASGCREVLYGGAVGGGKSDGLLMAAAEQLDNPDHRAIIFRRSFPRLKDLVARSHVLFLPLGGSYNKIERQWTFISGAIIEFGYLDASEDVYNYTGRAFSFIGFDELGEWGADDTDPGTGEPINRAFLFMVSRLRAVESTGLRLEIRSTCNPGGPGHLWIQKRYRIPGDGGATKFKDPLTGFSREFIPSRISDNPYLAGTDYERSLDALSPADRLALKDGRWDAHKDNEIFLSFDLLSPCQYPLNAIWRHPLAKCRELFLGVDIGRVNDLTVFWVLEKMNDVLFTREILTLKGVEYDTQLRHFSELLALPNVIRAAADETGLGGNMVESASRRFPGKVEPVTFTAPMKEALAYPVRSAFERKGIRVPNEQAVTDDLRSVRRINTAAGNVRFDAARTPDGHGDRFWALALAIHAAQRPGLKWFDPFS